MYLRRVLIFVVSLFCCCAVSLQAQDTRPLVEPTFPSTCVVLNAPLQSTAAGPTIAESADAQNAESAAESELLTEALEHCGPNQAVELTLGSDSSFNAFLINPVDIPLGVSLLIDGGITVFASRDPRNYQNSDPATCGTYGPFPDYAVDKGCRALITMEANSGIYGYGVIDGQGQKPFIFYPGFSNANAPPEPYNWWDLTVQKNGSQENADHKVIPNCPTTPCGQASPDLISGGNIMKGLNQDLVLYKITIRNPPFHTVKLGGKYVTVWGVKVQAPWNIPNTDGFDLHASNSTIYDTTVANGDQEVALVSSGGIPTTNITVDHFNGYSKGGITVLGSGDNFSQLLIQNVNITGGVPSVVPDQSVNGLSVTDMRQLYNITTYGQALPAATNDLKAIQITNSSQTNASAPGADISGVTFKSFCIQDIVNPINFTFSGKDELPNLHDVTVQDIHILAPTNKFPGMNHGVPTGKQGGYQLSFVTHVPTDPKEKTNFNQFTLDNVVVDDYAPDTNGAGATSIASIDAEVNTITTATNIFPLVFNQLGATGSSPTILPGPPKLTLFMNSYGATTGVSSPSKAYDCSTATMPFLTGDLYLSLGSAPATGTANNLQSATVTGGAPITLNAVVQPAMSQTTNFEADIYGAKPGLLAVGSPTLTKPITFYQDSKPIGTGTLSANGTLATLVVSRISAGTHTYTAMYPKDIYYADLNFGSVTVQVPAEPAVLTSPAPGSKLSGSTVTFTWTPGSGVSVYQVAVGTKWPGAIDIYGGGATTATSVTVSGIPTNGVNVYVMLRSVINGVVSTNFYTYTAVGSLTAPALLAPVPSSHLPSSTAIFLWSPGSGPIAYLLNVGTKWPGADDIYGSGVTTATSATVSGLPTNGVNVYVLLRYLFNGVWTDINYTYTADGSTVPPVFTTPAPGSVLPGANVTFNWTSGTGVTAYALSVGTYGPGYYNIYSSPQLATTFGTVPGIPTNGKPVYVTLRYQINGVWQTTSYTYTAAP